MHIFTLSAESVNSLRVRANPAKTFESDVQATQKLGFLLHHRMTA
jgi:hypothetical protein